MVHSDAGRMHPPPFNERTVHVHHRLAVSAALALGTGAGAQDRAAQQTIEPLRMAECAAIGAAADRLACYDQLAGRAAPAPVAERTDKASDSLLAQDGILLPAASRAAAEA